ncbi:hypothetical protein [Nonomuraea sp. NPDC050643]|uniref:hypothetical protein n=1 Tax=Nonomuraea sp. NPDC050643 TaxID=3155660 RepID=UPI0033C74BD8
MSEVSDEDRSAISVQVTLSITVEQHAQLRELARRLPLVASHRSPSDGDDSDDSLLQQLLEGLTGAAADEYIEHITRVAEPTSLTRVRELRLAHLVERLFGGKLPSEYVIADVLGLTSGEARVLLSRVVAHNRQRLTKAMLSASRKALENSKRPDDKKRWIRCDIATFFYLRDLVSQIAERGGPSLPPLSKRTDAVGGYVAPTDTFLALCRELGVEDPWQKNSDRRKK